MLEPGLRSRRFLGGVRFLATMGVRVGFFRWTSDVQLDHFLHQTPKLGIPVATVQFLLKLLLKHISCCAPCFPFISTAKFNSFYAKESESEILERSELESELDILLPTPQPWFEHLRVCTGTYYHDRQFIWKYMHLYKHPMAIVLTNF